MKRSSNPTGMFATHSGRVSEFDDHVGAGTVTDGEGRRFWFHCTAIADGSRVVSPGAQVRFRLLPGPTGPEAAEIEPAAGAGQPPPDSGG